MATGRELLVLRGHRNGVMSVAFSPDGMRLASGSWDQTVRVWDSVPYRVRYPERRAVLAARPEAEDVVDGLRQQFTEAKTTAERLRGDASLNKPVRRVALNVLLMQSAQLQEILHTHLRTLYARLVFTEDVVAALRADDSLAADVRDRAISKARLRGDTPFRLHQDSWNLVHSSGGDPDAYTIGLRGAEAAVAAQPDDILFLVTLAVAQYRNERYEEACTVVARCDELSWPESDASRPKGLAVLTMALFRLGRVEEAQAVFAQLQGMMHGGSVAYRPATALFEECKQLLEGSSGPPDLPENDSEGEN
jgi:hypothetical protein